VADRRQVVKTPFEEMVDQRRPSGADVDDGFLCGQVGGVDQVERQPWH